MKRFKLIAVLLLLVTLTGCMQKYDYSDEQTDAAAEYMAGLILRYDKDYKNSLMTLDEIASKEESEKASVTPAPNAAQNSVDGQAVLATNPTTSPEQEYTLSDVINEKGFDLSYTGYTVADSYPEDTADAYFSISAREGNQLVVLSFQLKNKLDKKNTLNLTKANISYQLDVNVGTIYEPPFALLENNLKLIDITLKKKEEKTVILIFEVKKNVEMKTLNLMVTRDNRSEILKLK